MRSDGTSAIYRFSLSLPGGNRGGRQVGCDHQMITPSAYVRRAVARSLQADGAQMKKAMGEPDSEDW